MTDVPLNYDVLNGNKVSQIWRGFFEWLRSSVSRSQNIESITASVASNALTITLSPTILDFRSSTLSSGEVTTLTTDENISLTISSGSTLGTVNAIQNRLAVIAINYSNTVELAVVNLAGGNQLDETNLITTVAEGGAGAADSNNVIYSTTARTSVPYRVVGYVESTQATAGTWATAPSTIQGYGGEAFAMASMGYGQTWQDLTGSRAVSTTYYNTTGKPISCIIRVGASGSGTITTTPVVGGVTLPVSIYYAASGGYFSVYPFVVPPRQSYSFTVSGVGVYNAFFELR